MRFFRKDRVASLIREQLAFMLLREIEVAGALITLTDVEVQKKLERAVVKVSVLPSEKALEVIRVLEKQARHLQFLLLRKINIKPMPHLVFQLDLGLEKAANIEKALLKDNNGGGNE